MSDLADKLILAVLLGIALLFPVYKFIFTLSARKYSIEEFELNKKKIKKKAFIYSSIITIIFSVTYSIQVF